MHKMPSSVLLVLLGAAAVLGLSCDPETEKKISGADYFPLRVGNYQVYHVTETQIAPYDIETDYEYDLKTIVTDSFPNATGGYSYTVSRYKRFSSTDPWESFDTWTIRADNREVVVTEGSTPFVRLSFPLKNNRTWNGNAYNNLESIEFCSGTTFISCDLYEMQNVFKEFITPNEITFANTVEVIQNNSPDLTDKYDIRKEVYAYGIGLVYKQSTVLQYCTANNCQGQQMVEDGLILTQELTDYGHE